MKQLNFNAKRVFEAISKIGYRPSRAIADILDNSVSAFAKKIDIYIDIVADKTFVKGNNINKIVIVDNGVGMDEEGIENALTLGSSNEFYSNDSLSKYGMGLKSAGFSLGNKITLTSQKLNGKVCSWYLDINKLEDGYKIYETPDIQNHLSDFSEKISPSSSFTIVQIDHCDKKTYSSAKKIFEELKNQLGVIYYPMLKDNELEINIIVTKSESNEILKTEKVQGKDILFRDKIKMNEFNKDTYDYCLPIRVLKEEIEIRGVQKKANIEIVIFPQANMSRYSLFTDEQKELIKTYEVGSKNSGFFIYRNGRNVLWGDKIEYQTTDGNISQIVPRDRFGFRAILNIYTEHDEALNVDVSKQHLDMPDDFLSSLEAICRNPLSFSDQAFTKCSELLRADSQNSQGQNFTEKNKYLSEEDPDEENLPSSVFYKIDTKEAKKRQTEIEALSKVGQQINQSENPDKQTDVITNDEEHKTTEDTSFLKIRYSNDINIDKFWEHGFSSIDGVFAVVNKNHNYYSNVLSRLSAGDTKESIEGIIWALAAAEYLTIKNLTTLSKESIEIVLNKFQKTFTHNLASWGSINNDLEL